jgi:hypothetical protein
MLRSHISSRIDLDQSAIETSAHRRQHRPTGRYEMRYGKDGEAGYLRWLAVNHPGYFSALYGRLMPTELNQKVETTKTVVRYETAAERRQAMIDKGWSPAVLEAMEEAMEPKFLRDLRAEKAKQVN